MKNKNTKIGLAIAAIIIVVIACYAFFSGSSETQITVETIKASKGAVTKMVTATGTVEPLTQVDVGTQVSGEVEKIYVDYNSVVKKGELIAELDKTNLKASLAQAQATYNSATNEMNYLQTIFNRQKSLFENKVISQADYDEALYNLNNAKNTVAQRYSDVQEAKTNLSYAEIYSPIDGVVLSKEIDEGQTVAASFETPTLFTIAKDLKEMQVEADVDEADIGEVKEGQRVMFTVDAYPNEEFEGTITQVRLDPTEESNVITYTVVIKAANPDLKLKPGLTATVYIYTLELNDVLTVEAKAANFNPDPLVLNNYTAQHEQAPITPKTPSKEGTLVYTISNGKIEPKNIVLGQSDGVHIEVKSGLKEGEELVYHIEEVSADAMTAQGDNESPFMPKPPGRDKKK